MINLGNLLEDADPQAARAWYEQAAAAGDPNAMLSLGLLLENSDPPTARAWYERAAAAGHLGATNNLGRHRPAGAAVASSCSSLRRDPGRAIASAYPAARIDGHARSTSAS